MADIFPLMEGAEFDELVEDVRAHGLREPITTFEGMILDGRNRYRACLAAGVEPQFVPFKGKDPFAFVISKNLKRRHLNESQRAMAAERLATLSPGRPSKTGRIAGLTQEKAAALLSVGERLVRDARKVRKRGAPELIAAVGEGGISVSAAADLAALSRNEQRALLARVDDGEILRKAQELRAAATEERRKERIARAVELSNHNAPLPKDRKYALILADPPWKYEFSKTNTRAIEKHYPTLPLEEIKALPVQDIAAPNAILFLWTPSAILEQAFEVIRSWDFAYAASAVWVKDKIGVGWYFRLQHEYLLVATRGDMPAPPSHARPSSIIQAPRGRHSEKPAIVYEIIEKMYPDLRKIELFARSRRPGWDAHGNEAPLQEAAE